MQNGVVGGQREHADKLDLRIGNAIRRLSARHYPSAEPGTVRSAAWKPTFEWAPSQKGFVVDAPQRQSATASV